MNATYWSKLKQVMLEGLADYGLSLAGICEVVSGDLSARFAEAERVRVRVAEPRKEAAR